MFSILGFAQSYLSECRRYCHESKSTVKRSSVTHAVVVNLMARRTESFGAMVRAAGLEPAWACAQRIFVPATAFAARSRAIPRRMVWGLDYPFTLALRL
jgi:hypothetical protein